MIVCNKITSSSNNKGDNYCENCPRVKPVGDWKKICPQGIFLQQQKSCDLKHDAKGNCPKGN